MNAEQLTNRLLEDKPVYAHRMFLSVVDDLAKNK